MKWKLIVWLLFCCGSAGLANTESSELEEAVWLATLGEYQRALEIFEALLQEEPDNPSLNYYAAVSHYFLDDLDEARSLLQKAVDEEPRFPQAYYWYGRVLAENAEQAKAAETTAIGLKHFPKNEKLLKLASRLQLQTDQQTEAPSDPE
jgi:tetratricopeptide (TPR) repeat protein